MKDSKMDGYGGDEKYRILVRKQERKRPHGRLGGGGVDGRIILKRILKK
jgi:hypothetical protein